MLYLIKSSQHCIHYFERYFLIKHYCYFIFHYINYLPVLLSVQSHWLVDKLQ
jgi:hypothetical protein